MKKSIPVAKEVDKVEPASEVPIKSSLLRPQVVCFWRTSATRSRSEVTEAVYAADAFNAPASFRMNSLPTMICLSARLVNQVQYSHPRPCRFRRSLTRPRQQRPEHRTRLHCHRYLRVSQEPTLTVGDLQIAGQMVMSTLVSWIACMTSAVSLQLAPYRRSRVVS